MIIRPLDRDTDVAPVPDGGSDAAVITAERAEPAAEPAQLELSCRTGANGYQIVSVAGELDIATAEQAYSYLSEVIDGRTAPVTVDLSGLTFCDASGLGVLARAARYARQQGPPARAGLGPAVAAEDHADHRPGPGVPRAAPGRARLLSVTDSGAHPAWVRQLGSLDRGGYCPSALSLE